MGEGGGGRPKQKMLGPASLRSMTNLEYHPQALNVNKGLVSGGAAFDNTTVCISSM